MKANKSSIEDLIKKNITHPEFKINLIDLGLIYDIELTEDEISIVMTTLNPNSTRAGPLASEVESLLAREYEDRKIDVSFTWEPEWDPKMMSDKARRILDFS